MILFDSLILWNDMLSLNKFKEDKMNKIALISISLILLVIGIGCAAAADLNVNDASLGGSLGGGGNEKLFAPACVDESVSTEPVAVSDDGARPLNNVVNDSVDDGALHVVDKKYLGGVGTAATKIAAESAIKVIGMTAITAYTMARGGSNIKWKV